MQLPNLLALYNTGFNKFVARSVYLVKYLFWNSFLVQICCCFIVTKPLLL